MPNSSTRKLGRGTKARRGQWDFASAKRKPQALLFHVFQASTKRTWRARHTIPPEARVSASFLPEMHQKIAPVMLTTAEERDLGALQRIKKRFLITAFT